MLLVNQIAIHVLYMVTQYSQTLCFSVSGESLTRRVRYLTFKAMLQQEIGWFDDNQNTTGILVGTLSDDGRNVQAVCDTFADVLDNSYYCQFSYHVMYVLLCIKLCS